MPTWDYNNFIFGGTKLVSSEFATEEDGYEDKEVMVKRGGFWERIFETDPTLHLWDDYKPIIIRVPKRKPIAYRIYDMIVAHPIIIEKLTTEFGKFSTATKEATFSMEGFKNAVAKLENFK